MNDKELLNEIRQNNSRAFKILFERYYEDLLAYVTTFTHDSDQAKDIVQNCFIALWKKRNQLSENSSLKNYLYTSAYNAYISVYRKTKFKNVSIEKIKFAALQEHLSDDTASDKAARIDKLKGLIAALPPRCREILLLNKQEGMKYNEIAQKLNISVKTVESQMRIAFSKIREGFEQ